MQGWLRRAKSPAGDDPSPSTSTSSFGIKLLHDTEARVVE